MTKSVIEEEKELVLFNHEELKEVQKPIGKAIYKAKVGRPRKMKDKALPSDRVKCKYCGKVYRRSNKSAHDKTQIHKIYVKMNNNMKKLLID